MLKLLILLPCLLLFADASPNCSEPDQHPCGNGTCINSTFVCDGYLDCENGTDEADCYTSTCNATTQFECDIIGSNETCLHIDYLCNYWYDCRSGADELDCETCPAGKRSCGGVLACTAESNFCDVYHDCYNSKDEILCIYTPEKLAQTVMAKTDGGVNPCEDFDKYACNNVIKYTTYSGLLMPIYNHWIVDDILSENNEKEQWNYLKNMRKFYASCLKRETAPGLGFKRYMNSSFSGEWPSLQGEVWDGELTFDLDDAVVKYGDFNPLFFIEPGVNVFNTSQRMLSVYPSRIHFASHVTSNSQILDSLKNTYIEHAYQLGANRSTATKDAEQVANFILEQLKIIEITDRGYSNDADIDVNHITLAEVGNRYNYTDIPRVARAMYSMINITLADEEPVQVITPSYFEKLGTLIAKTSNRTLQNFLSSEYVYRMWTTMLSSDYTYVDPRVPDLSLKRLCQEEAASAFELALTKSYAHKVMSEETKASVGAMVNQIKEAYSDMLDEAPWIDQKTKSFAKEKVQAMKVRIGFDDVTFGHAYLEEFYKELNLSTDDFYANLIETHSFNHKEELKKLRKPAENDGWFLLRAFDINLLVIYEHNEIVVPAGIIHPFHFSPQQPEAMNFGNLGSFIGAAMMSGIDHRHGIYRDKDGKLGPCWLGDSLEEYKNRTLCFEHQYSNDLVEYVIANITGAEASYRAYRKVVSAERGQEQALPGVNITNDQLFFLYYAQARCHYIASFRYTYNGTSDDPIARERFLRPLQYMPEFSEAYNCPAGSRMNPPKSCDFF